MQAHSAHEPSSGDAQHGAHSGQDDSEHSGGRHEGHSAAGFRRRFWICLAVTVPVLLISPGLPFVTGGRLALIPGADWILLGLSTFLYIYGGMRFSKASCENCAIASPV
jgi:Cu2+-exporting ATPase